MSYYRTCPDCGSNLDPGEICDCQLNYEEDTDHENETAKNTHPELQRV
jgi:hypothetical protein